MVQPYLPGVANVPHARHPSAHPSPQLERYLHRFSHFAQLPAEYRRVYARKCSFPLKIVPFHGGALPPCNTWFLEPTGAHNRNGILIGSAVFAQPSPQSFLYFTMGRPFSPVNSNFPWGCGSPCNTRFLVPRHCSQGVQPVPKGRLCIGVAVVINTTARCEIRT